MNELSLLDNLPPLDLPKVEGRAEIRTASAPVADDEAVPAAVPVPVAESSTASATTGVVPVDVPDPAGESVVPGLRKFAVVEPKLAGGSRPTSAGLDWLAEKGYKTLVDLREPAEVQPSFLAEVSKRGMRYISLPMSLATVDHDHVTRFHFEISMAESRPLYFFDTEGNRAGLFWYIHRMTLKDDRYDPQEASREAEEIGLADPEYRKAAEAYLDRSKQKPRAEVTATIPSAAMTTSVPPSPTTSSTATPPVPPGPAPEQDPTLLSPDVSTTPAKPEALALPEAGSLNTAAVTSPADSELDAKAARDPNAWRPFLALLLTGMGAPIAYWSRSFLSFRSLKRASLPGPARRLRSLPAASGE